MTVSSPVSISTNDNYVLIGCLLSPYNPETGGVRHYRVAPLLHLFKKNDKFMTPRDQHMDRVFVHLLASMTPETEKMFTENVAMISGKCISAQFEDLDVEAWVGQIRKNGIRMNTNEYNRINLQNGVMQKFYQRGRSYKADLIRQIEIKNRSGEKRAKQNEAVAFRSFVSGFKPK